MQGRSDRETVLRIHNGAVEQFIPWQPLVAHIGAGILVSGIPTRYRARYRVCSQIASGRNFVVTFARIEFNGCFLTGTATGIQSFHFFGFGVIDQPEIVTAQRGHLWIDDIHRRCNGNRCIDCITAILKNFKTRHGSQIIRRSHAPYLVMGLIQREGVSQYFPGDFSAETEPAAINIVKATAVRVREEVHFRIIRPFVIRLKTGNTPIFFENSYGRITCQQDVCQQYF